MGSQLTTKTITCKICCFSTIVVVNDPNDKLPQCERCGGERWEVSKTSAIDSLKPIPYIKSLLHTKIF